MLRSCRTEKSFMALINCLKKSNAKIYLISIILLPIYIISFCLLSINSGYGIKAYMLGIALLLSFNLTLIFREFKLGKNPSKIINVINIVPIIATIFFYAIVKLSFLEIINFEGDKMLLIIFFLVIILSTLILSTVSSFILVIRFLKSSKS